MEHDSVGTADAPTRRQGMANGFTVVELLIVLAIAGVILMLVIMAFPALARNDRNTRRKQDVAAILEAVSRWELTNSANYPVTGTDNFLQYSKLHFYDIGSVNAAIRTPGAGSIGANTALDTVRVYNRAACDPASSGGATGAGAGYNDVVALYAIETTTSTSSKCQQL